MRLTVPQDILDYLDRTLASLSAAGAVCGCRFSFGNEPDAFSAAYDDSAWQKSDGPVFCRKHQGTTWIRFDAEIPEAVLDIPVAGTAVRLFSKWEAPMDVYVDGVLRFSEQYWMDFKYPEVPLADQAVPGSRYQVALKLEFGDSCYEDCSFSIQVMPQVVEDAEFEIRLFKEEMAYACRFPQASEALDGVFALMRECTQKGCGPTGLLEQIRAARALLGAPGAGAREQTVHMVGVTHIDMNWTWPMGETCRVICRDFTTMADIMEETPEFRFSHSQGATYEIVGKNRPDVFASVRRKIDAGSWDVVASEWVEGDMNLVSGESIARRILISKKYCREKLGADPRILWCPDTFGHSGNLPQIARLSGIEYYFCMRGGKLGRESFNDFDYFHRFCSDEPLFFWEGIDGSRLLAFNSIYGSDVKPEGIFCIAGYMKDAYGVNQSMFMYGTGDHGGGPTRRDIRKIRRMESSALAPSLKFSTPCEFFDLVAKDRAASIPVIRGELNFIFEGCYSTQERMKRYNRRCENMLFAAETLSAAGSLLGLPYGRDTLDVCWKSALFNQFHDIMGGCGVRETYEYSFEIADAALNTLGKMTQDNLQAIGSRIRASRPETPLVLFNPTGWERGDCVKVPIPEGMRRLAGAVDADGNRLPAQVVDDKLYIAAPGIPAVGYKTVWLDGQACGTPWIPVTDDGEVFRIETAIYRAEVKKGSGQIVLLYDKINRRHVVRKARTGWRPSRGVLNTLEVHREISPALAAWTIGETASVQRLISGAEAAVKADGPVAKILNFKHRHGDSVISQDIVFYESSPQIDFETEVEWHERGDGNEFPTLKACFAPDVDNRDAAYEIPFGAISRPCKDMEVPALRWADISDDEYGMSLLNDCKHGHRTRGNMMELTLIRSVGEPDPDSAIGRHEFTYAVLPHRGGWEGAGTVREAALLNQPVLPVALQNGGQGGELPHTAGYLHISPGNAALSAFKLAESGQGYVVRLYNSGPSAETVTVETGFDLESVEEVNLMEEPLSAVQCEGTRKFGFGMRGFEIKTFRLNAEKRGGN